MCVCVCVCVCEQVSRGGVLSVNLFMRSLALSHAAPLAVAVKLLSIGTVCQIQWLHVKMYHLFINIVVQFLT